jgi:hypothetical protein
MGGQIGRAEEKKQEIHGVIVKVVTLVSVMLPLRPAGHEAA